MALSPLSALPGDLDHPVQAITLLTCGHAAHVMLHQCHSGVGSACQPVVCFLVEGFYVDNLETYIPTLQSCEL